MNNEKLWRKRFMTAMLARLFGLTVMLLGVAITFTDLLRQGGWPLVGGLLVIGGAIDALFAPRLMKKAWELEDADK